MNVVLVPGVLGAHIFVGQPYFNGVADRLRALFGANVLETEARPVGTVKRRSRQLSEQLVEHFGSGPDQKLIIIAHSMGGLDTRQMLTDHPDLARHVRSVT